MTMINLACRLPQIRWPTRRGSFVRENPGTPCRPLGTTRRTNVEDSLWTRPDIGPTPCGVLGEALLEPDLLQRNHSPAQETDLHPLHVGLIQVFKDRVVLGNPRGIVQDKALYLAVERDPLHIRQFLPGLLE